MQIEGNNKLICIGDKSVYFRNLAEKGIRRVGDLISNKNELIIKSELTVLHLSPLEKGWQFDRQFLQIKVTT